MADCSAQEKELDATFDDMADAMYDQVLAESIDHEAQETALGADLAFMAAGYLGDRFPNIVEDTERAKASAVRLTDLTEKLNASAGSRVPKAVSRFQEAVKELCECWEAGSKGGAGIRSLSSDAEEEDDGDDDDFDEMYEEADSELEGLDGLMETISAELQAALDGEDGDEGIASDVALIS